MKLIAAVSQNGVIGDSGRIPWHLPEDLKQFKEATMGGVVVMGRKTFDSIGGEPLPGRQTVVITSDMSHSITSRPDLMRMDLALARALLGHSVKPVWICGGASIYKAFMDRVDEIRLTTVRRVVPGDTLMPDIPFSEFDAGEVVIENPEFAVTVYRRLKAKGGRK